MASTVFGYYFNGDRLNTGKQQWPDAIRFAFEKMRKNIILSLMFNLCQCGSLGMFINQICMCKVTFQQYIYCQYFTGGHFKRWTWVTVAIICVVCIKLLQELQFNTFFSNIKCILEVKRTFEISLKRFLQFLMTFEKLFVFVLYSICM